MEPLRRNFGHFVALLLVTVSVTSKNIPTQPTEWNILMRGAKPSTPDSYLCSAYHVEYDEAYIYKFQAMAEASTAHHMLMYGCNGPAFPHSGDYWDCPPICQGRDQTIMFAWAKNAPPTVLPKDVGFKIGKDSRIKTIVLEIHYAKAFARNDEPDNSGLTLSLTGDRPKYSAGILLMLDSFFAVPPHTPSKVITGYQYNGSYHEIGKGNPQWPQAFYPVKDIIAVKKGDYLAARCTFDSTNRGRTTNVGATGDDEMCNFYIMYYTISTARDDPYECFDNEYPNLTGDHFPRDVSVPLPHNATMEEAAAGHHHGGHGHHPKPTPSSTKKLEETSITTTPTKPVQGKLGNSNPGQQYKIHDKIDSNMKSMGSNGDPQTEYKPGRASSDTRGYDIPGHENKYQADEENGMHEVHFPNYDYDNINPRDLSHKHRMNQEYYDDYAANDWREQTRYNGGNNPDVELSRNRNKEFDAMNKQLLQQQFSGKGSKSAPKAQPQQPVQNQQRLQPQQQLQQQRQRQHPTQRQRGPGVDQRQSSSRIAGNGGQRNPQAVDKPGHLARQGAGGGDNLVAIPHSNIHIENKLVYQPSWPSEDLNIGQVGGVSTDRDGNVYIFHRASRIWDATSFDLYNNFNYKDAPIDGHVVIILDKNGKRIREFGKGQFFMPHGITVDMEGNVWLTDVAMHQVFKINKDGSKPVMTLGHRFKHSQDLSYFCKPTDVAILSTGEFFVADGYCNSRIVKFSKDGKVLKAWGKPNTLSSNPGPLVFDIVHNIAVSEKDNLVCAADRENGRIQCFDLDGNFKRIIKHKEFGTKLFALEYSPRHGGVLYAVNSLSYDGSSVLPVQGFTMDMKNGALIETWNLPQSFKQPHDMCVDPTSDAVYVGELDPRMVWKLTRMSDEEAKNTFANLNHHGDHDGHEKPGTKTKPTDQKITSVTPTVVDKISSTGNHSNSSAVEGQIVKGTETGLSSSMIMGLILTVPVIVLLIVVLAVRSYRAGNLKCLEKGGKGGRRILNMQNIFGNSHKGFDRLSTEESDHELDPNDSDHDEYTAPKKAKDLNGRLQK